MKIDFVSHLEKAYIPPLPYSPFQHIHFNIEHENFFLNPLEAVVENMFIQV